MQHGSRCMIAAHPVDAGAGRGGGGAEKEPGVGGGVGIRPGHGPREHLAQVLHAADDVAADVVGVVVREIGGRGRVHGEDRVAEARGKALDLVEDGAGHVDRGAVGDVAVGPERVLVFRGARWIEKAGLGHEHERFLAVPAFPGIALARGDLLERAADVNRAPRGDRCRLARARDRRGRSRA